MPGGGRQCRVVVHANGHRGGEASNNKWMRCNPVVPRGVQWCVWERVEERRKGRSREKIKKL